MPSYALARPFRLDLEAFARTSGLHPQLVVRLVHLGALDAFTDGRGQLFFAPAELARAARIQRLRSGLSLNYAALGLVMDLLDRIDALEAALRGPSGPSERGRPTPTGPSERGSSRHVPRTGGADRRWT